MSRNYGLLPDKPDTRDLTAKLVSPTTTFPLMVDLRNRLEVPMPIWNQEWLGSCTSNAILMFKMFKDKQRDGYYFFLSRLYHYWKEREIEGTIDYDSGAYLRDGFKVLQQIGCATESYFPYIPSDYKKVPSIDAERNAPLHKIDKYYRIMTKDQLKAELVAGNPVVIGVTIYSSFESKAVADTGIVPMPDTKKEYALGGHAMLVVGYRQIAGKDYMITQNSWGADWGDKGYCYIPFDFIGWYIPDMWTGVNSKNA
jgi:C1A family cysteine protease